MKKKRKIRIDRLIFVIVCELTIILGIGFTIEKLIELVFPIEIVEAAHLPESGVIVKSKINVNIPEIKTEEKGEETKEEKEYLGTFLLTGYCPCEKCSEGYGRNTATGTIAKQGRTIAVDPNVIPYGSIVEIDGHEYIAEDCGGAINDNHIDVFMENHEDCFADECNGYHEVYLIKRTTY